MGEIRRVDEMARRVRFFASQLEKEKEPIPVRPLYDSAPLVTVGPRAAQTIDELDVKLAEHESRLTQMNESYQLLSERLRELVEARHVLRETAQFFDQVRRHCFLAWAQHRPNFVGRCPRNWRSSRLVGRQLRALAPAR